MRMTTSHEARGQTHRRVLTIPEPRLVRQAPCAPDPASGLSNRPGALRPIVIFAVLVAVFYAVVHSPGIEGRIFEPSLRLIAAASGTLLRALGFQAVVDGRLVQADGITVQIVRGCDGLEAIAVFVAAVLASPASAWPKVAGCLVGPAFLSLVNLLRVVSLFYVALHFPKAFDLIHEDLWQPAFVLIAVSAWLAWGVWATQRTRNRAHAGC